MQRDLDAIRRNFADMSTEALLEEWADGREVYEPEALDLLKRELLSRGLTREDLEKASSSAMAQAPDPGEVEVIASFDSLLFAQQAQDVLSQKGINSSLRGQGSLVWGFESVAAVPGAVEIVVLKKDADTARTALEEFTPVAEEREGIRFGDIPEDDSDIGR